jgi:cell division protein DivIC
MKLLHHFPSWLRNKYLNSFAAFCMILLFLDKNDLFTQFARKKELQGLETSKDYYTKEINKLDKEYRDLRNDPAVIEKLAREKFLMKRDNEELFVISEKHDSPKNYQ